MLINLERVFVFPSYFVSSFLLLCVSVSVSTIVYAQSSAEASSPPGSAVELNAALESTLDTNTRQSIKRQIMSRTGVFLAMANLTDAGYVWSNDVVWEGEDLIANERWNIAGFLFERGNERKVWLQYAFTLDDETGKLKNFQRWFGGASGFR